MSGARTESTVKAAAGGQYQLSSLWESHTHDGKVLGIKKDTNQEDSSSVPTVSDSSTSDADSRTARSLTPLKRTLRSLPLVSRQHGSPASRRGGNLSNSQLKSAPGDKHHQTAATMVKDQNPRHTLHTVPAMLSQTSKYGRETSSEALCTSSDVGSVADHTSMVWSEVGAAELMRQRHVPSVTSVHSTSTQYAPPGSIVYRSRQPMVPGQQFKRDRSVSPLQKQRIHIRRAVRTIGQILSRLGGNNPNSKVHDLHQIHSQDIANRAANPGQLHSNFAHVYRDQTPLVIERPGHVSPDHTSSQSLNSSPLSPLSRSHSSGCLDTLGSRAAVRQSDDWDAFFPCPSHVTLSTDRGSPIPPKKALQAQPFTENPSALEQPIKEHSRSAGTGSPAKSATETKPLPQLQPETQPETQPQHQPGDKAEHLVSTGDATQLITEATSECATADRDTPAMMTHNQPGNETNADVHETESAVKLDSSAAAKSSSAGEKHQSGVTNGGAMATERLLKKKVTSRRRKVYNPKKARMSPLMVHYHAFASADPTTSGDTSSSQQRVMTSPDSAGSTATPASLSSAAPRSLWGSSPMLWAAGVATETPSGPAPIATRSVSPASSLAGSPGMSHSYLESLISDEEENIPSPLSTMSSDWPVDFMYHDSPSHLSPNNILASLGPVRLSLSEKSSPHIFTYSPRHLTPSKAARLLRSAQASLSTTDLRGSTLSSRGSLDNTTAARTAQRNSTQTSNSLSGTFPEHLNTPRSTASTRTHNTSGASSKFTPLATSNMPAERETFFDEETSSQYPKSSMSEKRLTSVSTSGGSRPLRSSLSSPCADSFSSPTVKQLSDSGVNADISSSDMSPVVSNRIARFCENSTKDTAAYQEADADSTGGAQPASKLIPTAAPRKLETMLDSNLDSKAETALDSKGPMRLSSTLSALHVGLESSYLEYNPRIDCSPLGTALTGPPCQLPREKELLSAGSLLSSRDTAKACVLSPRREPVLRVSPRLDIKEGLTDLSSSDASQLIPACDSAPGLDLSHMGSTGSLDSDAQRSHPNSASDLAGLASKYELSSSNSLSVKMSNAEPGRKASPRQAARATSVCLEQCNVSSGVLDSSLSSSLLSPHTTARLAGKPDVSLNLHQTTHSDIKSTSSSAKAGIHRLRGSHSSGLSIETIDTIQRQLAPVAALSARSLGPRAPSSPTSSIDPVSATPRCKTLSEASSDISPTSGAIRMPASAHHRRQASDTSRSSSSIDASSGTPRDRPSGSVQSDLSARSGQRADTGRQAQSKLSPMFNVMSVLSHYRDELKGPKIRRSSSVAGALTTSSVPKLSQRNAVSLCSEVDLDTPVDEMIWTGSHSITTTTTILVNRRVSAPTSPRSMSKNATSFSKHSTSSNFHSRTGSHISNVTAPLNEVERDSHGRTLLGVSQDESDSEDDEAFGVPDVTCDSCVLYDTEQLQKQMTRRGEENIDENALHSTAGSAEDLHGETQQRRTSSSGGADAVILISQVPSTITSSSSCGDLTQAMRTSAQSQRDLVLQETASERENQDVGPSSSQHSSIVSGAAALSPNTSGTTKTSHASLEEISEVSSFPSTQPAISPPMYTSPVKIRTRRPSGPALSVTPSTAPATGMTYSGYGRGDALWSDPSVAAALSWGSAVGWSAPNTARGHPSEQQATPWPTHTPAAVQGLVMAALATAASMAGSPATAPASHMTPAVVTPSSGAASVPPLSRRAEVRNRRPMLPSGKAAAAAFGVAMDSALLESMGSPMQALSPSPDAPDAACPPAASSQSPSQSPKPARTVTARAKSGTLGGRASRASRFSVAASFSSDIFLTGNDLLETLENVMSSSAVEDFDSDSFDEMVTCLEERVLLSEGVTPDGSCSHSEVEKMVVAGGVAMLVVNVMMILLALMVVARTYRAV